MLRPANDALKSRKAETATTVAMLAFALIVPCVAILAAAFAGDAARGYLKAYRPIVYLSADVHEKGARQLAKELDAWPSVAQAKLRTPADALADLQERLGEQEVAGLGVGAQMLPYSVTLLPATPVIGHLDLIARASGLEARMEVDSVDVPSPKAAQTLSFVRWLMMLGAGLVMLMVVAGVGSVRGLLGRLADDQTRETELLALFGAPPSRLRRPTLIRGLTVGVIAGVVAFAALFVLLLLWQKARPVLVGLDYGASGWSWAVTVSPLVLGPLAGALGAWLANRSFNSKASIDGLDLETLVSPD